MATLSFILLLYLSFVLAVAASDTFGHHRRDHADLGRLVKKRSPLNLLGQPAAQSSSSPVVQLTQPTSSVAQTTPANSAPVPTTSGSASASASPSTSGGGGLLSSILSGLQPSQSSSASSTPSSTLSSTSSSSSSTPQTSPHTSDTPATTPTQSSTSSSAGIPHAAVTILIVIAASVGAAVIAWTIIRKWKFRPSSDFEGRMQPIDWQPDGSNENAGIPGHHRPSSRASSFHSGSANPHIDELRGGYGATTLNPIPDHDFTAGAAHLAPVGGYADLSRGPSPQPMMQESFGGAPSINRPVQYDQYGVPLYHGYSGY
ncbi:hypothetical protein L210DRAFT_3642126 [Boletus edulis BED1]|uniref:Uncharacterized protein n=1 Tax=Boletus edulis BED1 TaxID=1328754 RepID=A0AAD4C1F5_BOLED|nr:hypothetical protein L210DRAFT_3642126 [Boletus edulis BED1]